MTTISKSFKVRSTGMRPTFHTVTDQVKDILAETGASSATISRVNRCLNYGTGGYKAVLGQLLRGQDES